jgi:hypothetical protein
MFIASRMASPPVTDPGAESGARPPIFMGQSAANALPPQQIGNTAHTIAKNCNILNLFISFFLLSSFGFIASGALFGLSQRTFVSVLPEFRAAFYSSILNIVNLGCSFAT